MSGQYFPSIFKSNFSSAFASQREGGTLGYSAKLFHLRNAAHSDLGLFLRKPLAAYQQGAHSPAVHTCVGYPTTWSVAFFFLFPSMRVKLQASVAKTASRHVIMVPHSALSLQPIRQDRSEIAKLQAGRALRRLS